MSFSVSVYFPPIEREQGGPKRSENRGGVLIKYRINRINGNILSWPTTVGILEVKMQARIGSRDEFEVQG